MSQSVTEEGPERSYSRDHGGLLLAGLFPSGTRFIIQLWHTCPAVALPTMGWVHPHQSLIWKCPTNPTTDQPNGGVFSWRCPLPKMTLACDKLTKTNCYITILLLTNSKKQWLCYSKVDTVFSYHVVLLTPHSRHCYTGGAEVVFVVFLQSFFIYKHFWTPWSLFIYFCV